MKWGCLLVAAALLAVPTGCGGGSATDKAPSTAKDPLADYPGGPTRGFIVPGGDNAVPLFGHEATATEREQASATVAAWMRARAEGAWRRDCSHLSQRYLRTLLADAHGASEGRVKTCPQALAYFGPEASGNLKNTLTGPIDSLRAERGHGYAQYHGKGGIDWEIPMDKESGRWRVAAAAPVNQEG